MKAARRFWEYATEARGELWRDGGAACLLRAEEPGGVLQADEPAVPARRPPERVLVAAGRFPMTRQEGP